MKKILVSLVLITFMFSFSVFAQETLPGSKENPIRVVKTQSAIKIDGDPSDAAWKDAYSIAVNIEIDPGINIEAPVTTICKIAYDADNVYFLFICNDPNPEDIRANIADRDTPFRDDFAGIILDTFNDERRAFEIFVNPMGVQMDGIRNEVGGQDEDFSWDAIWYSAGVITDYGYVVEFALPFNQLRFSRQEGEQVWGFTPLRSYPRSSRHQISSIIFDHDNDSILSQEMKIIGFEGVEPGKNIEISPTVTASSYVEREDFPDGEFGEAENQSDMGVTARWGVTPNITAQLAINPDFSQVEADAVQLNINERFALQYQEKRPFFMEGMDIFDVGPPLVYTRAIANPNWGLKLSGKEGKNAFGLFVAEDAFTTLIFPGAYGSDAAFLDESSISTVGRYRRDVGKGSTVGMLFSDRHNDDYFSRAIAFDVNYRIDDSNRLSVLWTGSDTKYSEEIAAEYDQSIEAFQGSGYSMDYRHSKKNYYAYGQFHSIDENARFDLGFMPQGGLSQMEVGGGYNWYGGQEKWYDRLSVSGNVDRTTDSNGNLMEQESEAQFRFQGKMQSMFIVSGGMRTQQYDGKEYDQLFSFTLFRFIPKSGVEAEIMGAYSDAIDYYHSRPANSYTLRGSLDYNMGKHLKLNFRHSFRKLDVDGGQLYMTNLSYFSAVYQFNVRSFFRAIVQYSDVNRDLDLWEDDDVKPSSSDMFAQLLYSYKINPQTVLYLGYSDNRSAWEGLEMTKSDHTLFFKIGYAWIL